MSEKSPVKQTTTVQFRILKSRDDKYVVQTRVGAKLLEQEVCLGDYVTVHLNVKYDPMVWE